MSVVWLHLFMLTLLLDLGNLTVSASEIQYLKEAVPFLPSTYLEFLKTFSLNPETQTKLTLDSEGALSVLIKGRWVDTILYEIPVLALISEAYFKFVDTNWSYDGQIELAESKTKQLLAQHCAFSEFGTRRRRSLRTQRTVVQGIKQAAGDNPLLLGTSNVMLAKEFGLRPIGTVAHEWMMGIAAYTQNYKDANKASMDNWLKTVGDKAAGFALTDTFGTADFLKCLVPPYSDIYLGVRQDSGDPIVYTQIIADHYYKKLGYPLGTKKIIYSDSLDIQKCLQYKNAAEAVGLVPSFGIGTFFTNDYKCLSGDKAGLKSAPLNIVIKISKVNGNQAIKISDNINKNTGDKATVERVKRELGYIEKDWAEGDESKRWSK